MVDVKVYYSQRVYGFGIIFRYHLMNIEYAQCNFKVYYSQRKYIVTFAESICIYKFNECISENVLII